MRADAGVDVGDRAAVELTLDREPRTVPMASAFSQALAKNKKAKTAFEKLPPSHQKEILTYLNWLKKPASLQRNIERTIAYLLRQNPK